VNAMTTGWVVMAGSLICLGNGALILHERGEVHRASWSVLSLYSGKTTPERRARAQRRLARVLVVLGAFGLLTGLSQVLFA